MVNLLLTYLNIIIGIIFVNISMNFIIINYLIYTPVIFIISHTKIFGQFRQN
jgi:hypothetical protein